MSSVVAERQAVNAEVFNFEDLNPFNKAGVYYWVPNEELTVWRSFLNGIRVDRAAGICSAGEVGLFGLLTHARKELVLVDHSYASLAVAMVKYAALRKYGWKRTKELFSTCTDLTLHKTVEELKAELPTAVQKHVPQPYYSGFDNDYSSYEAKNIQREWKSIEPRLLRKACEKLDKVNFLHGDLSDVADRGPFDVFYLSNAHQHQGRVTRGYASFDWSVVAKIIKPGGHLIVAGANPAPPKTWTKLNYQRGDYKGEKIGWEYLLYQTPVAEAVAA